MNIIEHIDALLEAKVRWKWPTKKQLVDEFETEPWIRSLFGGDISWVRDGTYDDSSAKRFFLDHLKKVSKTKVFKKPPRGIEFHKADSIDKLAQKTEYMGKDVQSLADAMKRGGSLPMPILVKSGGTYKMLGGRTRFGVASILGTPVKAIVVDLKRLAGALQEWARDEFIHNPKGIIAKAPVTAEEREEWYDWVWGGQRGPMPLEGLEKRWDLSFSKVWASLFARQFDKMDLKETFKSKRG